MPTSTDTVMLCCAVLWHCDACLCLPPSLHPQATLLQNIHDGLVKAATSRDRMKEAFKDISEAHK